MVGQTVILTGTFSNPGSTDPHTVTVVWGDGTVNIAEVDLDDDPRSFELFHAYQLLGPFTVAVVVSSSDGTPVCDARTTV